jgi:hypothetical protein
MAKRKLKDVATAPAMVDFKPRMHIDLHDEDVDMLKDLKVGQTVRVAIKGKVVSVSQRSNDYRGEKSKNGDFALEDFDVEFIGENEFEALSDD